MIYFLLIFEVINIHVNKNEFLIINIGTIHLINMANLIY